jgi:hypothetical protein
MSVLSSILDFPQSAALGAQMKSGVHHSDFPARLQRLEEL